MRYLLIVWECELKKSRLEETIEAVANGIRLNGEILRSAQDDREKTRALYREERRLRREREVAAKAELQAKYPKK